MVGDSELRLPAHLVGGGDRLLRGVQLHLGPLPQGPDRSGNDLRRVVRDPGKWPHRRVLRNAVQAALVPDIDRAIEADSAAAAARSEPPQESDESLIHPGPAGGTAVAQLPP